MTQTALQISGRTGRHALINGIYEPMQTSHNGKLCWVMRAVTPCYLFHTGQGRWVINKWLDNGKRNWAFIPSQNDAEDPSHCTGTWTCCDEDGQWRPDPGVSCLPIAASQDKFVLLRLSLDDEMRKLGLIDPSSLKTLWRRLDFNGNGIVSLAEIDKMVVDLTVSNTWPAWMNNKPALMRAYKKTILHDEHDIGWCDNKQASDDWVQKREFHALLLNIFWFNRLWAVFDDLDTSDDRRIDCTEFTNGLAHIGLHLSGAEALTEFSQVDMDGRGMVLFVEFCAYVRKRLNPDAHTEFDADIRSGTNCGKAMRKDHGSAATHSHFVGQKTLRDFDETETKVKALLCNPKRMSVLWNTVDFNGDNNVSLAELDKFIANEFPILNHRPALHAAFKRSVETGEESVQKEEFVELLARTFYFNKVCWLYDKADCTKNQRLNFQEFKCCSALCGHRISENEAQLDFARLTRDVSGSILFGDYCDYFTKKMCPQATTLSLQ